MKESVYVGGKRLACCEGGMGRTTQRTEESVRLSDEQTLDTPGSEGRSDKKCQAGCGCAQDTSPWKGR